MSLNENILHCGCEKSILSKFKAVPSRPHTLFGGGVHQACTGVKTVDMY